MLTLYIYTYVCGRCVQALLGHIRIYSADIRIYSAARPAPPSKVAAERETLFDSVSTCTHTHNESNDGATLCSALNHYPASAPHACVHARTVTSWPCSGATCELT